MSIKDYQNGFALGKASAGVTGVKEKPLPLCEIDNKYSAWGGKYTEVWIYPNDYPNYISLPNGTTGFAKLQMELQHASPEHDAGGWKIHIKLKCFNANGTVLKDISVFEQNYSAYNADVNITQNISVDLATFPSGTAKFYPFFHIKEQNGYTSLHRDKGHIKISNIRVEEED